MDRIADGWQDYQCLYAGNGLKIERWQDFILSRPDPLAIWPLPPIAIKIDASYQRSNRGGGCWQYQRKLPDFWSVNYRQLRFKVSTLGFKHTGLFPEQAANWDSLTTLIQQNHHKKLQILNLFAYTGAATLACAAAGATEVVHVDASKGMVQWAKENAELSQLSDRRIRFIVDDCFKFLQREQRRGRKYQGIIMDPPSYGRGPNNEIWKFDNQINELLSAASQLLADDALFFLVNSYSAGYSATVLANIFQANETLMSHFKTQESGELLLPISRQNITLPAGIYGLASND